MRFWKLAVNMLLDPTRKRMVNRLQTTPFKHSIREAAMSITHLLVAASIAAPSGPPAMEAGQQRLCTVGPRGSVQLAYKSSGNPVFGSDGLTCAAAKPESDARPPAAPRGKAEERPSRQHVRTFNNSVETGP